MGHRTPRRNRIEPNQRGIREGGEEKQRAEGAGRRRAYPAPRETRRVLACGRAAGIGGRRGIGDGGREPSRVWLVDAGVVAGWGGNGDEARRDEASETAGGRAGERETRDGTERRPRSAGTGTNLTRDRVGFGLALAPGLRCRAGLLRYA